MKRKMMVLVLALLCILPLTVQSASAGWVVANVVSVGIGDGVTYIALNDTAATPAFPPGTYFICDATRAKEMLATALTAISLSKTVNVWVASNAPYSQLMNMYLNQ